MGIAIRRLDGIHKDLVYIERDDLAEAMISTGQAELATFGEHNVSSPAPAVETPESSKAISDMSIAELKAELKRRGLSNPLGSGSGGKVIKRDLVNALT